MSEVYSKSNSTSMSDDIRLITRGLLNAKKQFKATGKSGINNHQNYTYAKIEDVYNAVEDALHAEDIVIVHYANFINMKELLFTRLIHSESGQYIEDIRILESQKPGNQERGSANTYMRKYAVLSLCSIPAVDDDGEAEEKYIEEQNNDIKNKILPADVISNSQEFFLVGKIKDSSNSGEIWRYIKSHYNIRIIKDIKAADFDEINRYIEEHAIWKGS